MDPRASTLFRKSIVVVTAASGANAVPDNADVPVTLRSLIYANASPALSADEKARIMGCRVVATGAALQFGRVATHMGVTMSHVVKVAINAEFKEPALDTVDWLVQAQGAADTSATILVYMDATGLPALGS